MGKILEWHKKILSDTRPLAGFQVIDDGEGNKDVKLFIGGSKFWYWERRQR